MSALQVLVLEPDNPCNTTITDKNSGETLYTVATEHSKETVTKVKNASEETIASWQWKDIRSDILTLKNGSPVPASTWLRKSIVPFKDTVYFSDMANRKYKWKGNGPGLNLELFSEVDKVKPIAKFKKAYHIRDKNATPPKEIHDPATLTLDQAAQEIQDMVIISFCMLEKSRRAREASTLHSAESAAVPALSLSSRAVPL